MIYVDFPGSALSEFPA